MDKTQKNKILIEKYPFLLPRNRFTDKVPEDYDYSYTELDALPDGWRDAFGKLLCEDIKNKLVSEKPELLNEYRITQIKEKYGSLRWYSNFTTEKVEEVITKYTRISEYTCIKCGKFPVSQINDGWIQPLCYDCYAKTKSEEKDVKNSYKNETTQDLSTFSPLIHIVGYKNNKEYEKIIDASDVLEKIERKVN